MKFHAGIRAYCLPNHLGCALVNLHKTFVLNRDPKQWFCKWLKMPLNITVPLQRFKLAKGQKGSNYWFQCRLRRTLLTSAGLKLSLDMQWRQTLIWPVQQRSAWFMLRVYSTFQRAACFLLQTWCLLHSYLQVGDLCASCSSVFAIPSSAWKPKDKSDFSEMATAVLVDGPHYINLVRLLVTVSCPAPRLLIPELALCSSTTFTISVEDWMNNYKEQ